MHEPDRDSPNIPQLVFLYHLEYFLVAHRNPPEFLQNLQVQTLQHCTQANRIVLYVFNISPSLIKVITPQSTVYINLRRSRDGTRCSDGCTCVSDPRSIQFALGSCYAVHIKRIVNINFIMKVYRKKEHSSQIYTIP